jgi:hypothetical protein
MKIKTMVIKSSLFLIILGVILALLGPVFIPKTGVMATQIRITDDFYDLPENSIDVLFLGASTFMRGISPLTLWEKHGITSYVRAGPAQVPLSTYYTLMESLKYQHPKLVVLDASSLYKGDYDINEKEAWLRVSTDPLKFSTEKVQMIADIKRWSADQSVISYLFPFFRYHSRWDQLSFSDFKVNRKEIGVERFPGFKGFRPSTDLEGVDSLEETSETLNQLESVSDFSRDYYEKMIEICRQNDIDIILVSLPKASWTTRRNELLQKFANDYNLEYIDLSLPRYMEKMNFDFAYHLKDTNHPNVAGALKITKELGMYINRKFDFIDKRTDSSFSSWNEDLGYYRYWMKRNLPGYPQLD